jgi:hypothetical protein
MESNRLVSHICYEVGFNNVANFNRRFLEVKGRDAEREPMATMRSPSAF